MSGFDIQKKVKSGLAKANKATGAGIPIYKVEMVESGGDSPLDPPVIVENNIHLVDAIFKSYDKSIIDGSMIQAGDREMVSNSDNEIFVGDIIQQSDQRYVVIEVDKKDPVGIPLVYISQVRAQ